MDEQGKLSNNQHNTIPLADGWCLRDSKSNPGRKYYFNPITKQSLWHITDDEIKLLEQRTNNQVNTTKSDKPTKVPILPEEGSTSAPTIANIMRPTVHVNELPYDPRLWAVPPRPEIISTAFINSSNPSMPFSNQTSFFDPQSHLPSNIPHDTNKTLNRNRLSLTIGNNSQQTTQPRKTYNQKFANAQTNVGDLRDELKYKRFHSKNSSSSKANEQRNNLENITWNEETVKSVFLFLSRKISPTARNDCWYIVPDTNVVEKNSTLLSMMTNLVPTDTVQRCCLKIPPFVMMELKNIAQKPGNALIRRFMRYGRIETFSESQNNAEHNEISSIIETCKKLIEDNYHVVVLCQDILFKDLRMSLTNPVFTIPKMMECINKGKYPRTNMPQGTALSNTVSSESKNEINKCEENSSSIVEDSSESTLASQISNEEPQATLEANEVNDVTNTVQNIVVQRKPKQIDSNVEKSASSKIISLLNQNVSSMNTPLKRTIKLNKTNDNNTLSGQSSVRRRWSATTAGKRNKANEGSEAVKCIQDNQVTNNAHKENLCTRTEPNIENKNNPRIELSGGASSNSKVLSSCESLPNTLSSNFASKPECNIINEQKKTVLEDIHKSVYTDYEVTNNRHKENSCKESNIENKNIPRIEIPRDDCKVLTSEVSFVNEPSTSFAPKSECNMDTKQKNINIEDISKISVSTANVLIADKSRITNETVLDSLKTQGSEWISRYMEIIENILLRILNQEPKANTENIPQLQRLRKATIEVIKNYSHCCYIVDAANKLSMKLNKISNESDTSAIQKVFEDTETYFHGVNLVKSLQEINQNDEYIQNAKILLENIFSDIHKPRPNVANRLQEITITDSQRSRDDVDAPISEFDTTPSELETIPKSENGYHSERNDTSANKRKLEEAAKIQHFKALKLRKVDHDLPTIISNEDTDGYDDIINESKEDNIDPVETDEDNKVDIEYPEVIEPQDFLNQTENGDLLRTNNGDNEKFQLFIAMFLKEIRETFLVCAQYVETCLTQENDNNAVNHDLTEVYALLYKIWQSLDSILKRETGDGNNKFKSLLNDAGFDISIDQHVCDEYRDIIHKCRDEVKVFLNLIQSRGISS